MYIDSYLEYRFKISLKVTLKSVELLNVCRNKIYRNNDI